MVSMKDGFITMEKVKTVKLDKDLILEINALTPEIVYAILQESIRFFDNHAQYVSPDKLNESYTHLNRLSSVAIRIGKESGDLVLMEKEEQS